MNGRIEPVILDLFSGIGGFSLAARRAGFRTAAFSEIEPFPSRVLAQRFPGRRNLGDVTKLEASEVGRVAVLTGGFPCQDLSVAGKRRGLAGRRSGLFWEIVRLAGELQPPWLVLENVPGLLSSNGGRDFGTVVHALEELGYGVAWRVLDAQHFGVPQRRRRVFVVCRLGAPCPPEVLFEPEGGARHLEACREAGAGATPILEVGARTNGDGHRDGDGIGDPGDPMYTLQAGKQHGVVSALTADGVGTCGADDNQAQAGHLIGLTNRGYPTGSGAFETLRSDSHGAVPMVANGLTQRYGKGTDSDATDTLIAHALTGEGFDASEDGTGRGTPIVPVRSAGAHGSNGAGIGREGDPSLTLDTDGSAAVAFTERDRKEGRTFEYQSEMAYALTNPASGGRTHSRQLYDGVGVRRLTPLECERLQGFPDGWSDIPGASDSARYRALGNAVAVPVVEWIMHRLYSAMRLEDAA